MQSYHREDPGRICQKRAGVHLPHVALMWHGEQNLCFCPSWRYLPQDVDSVGTSQADVAVPHTRLSLQRVL